MTGAELLALARHSRGAGEGDDHIAVWLVNALRLLWPQITPEQRCLLHGLLQRMIDRGPVTNS